jgi:hypothetical protein
MSPKHCIVPLQHFDGKNSPCGDCWSSLLGRHTGNWILTPQVPLGTEYFTFHSVFQGINI